VTFEQIVRLLKHNSTPADWNVLAQAKSSVAYCLEDVNLRLALNIIKQGGVEQFQIQVFYSATTIMSVILPNVSKKSQRERLLSALAFSLSTLAHPKRR
jgi:hypothetical protein